MGHRYPLIADVSYEGGLDSRAPDPFDDSAASAADVSIAGCEVGKEGGTLRIHHAEARCIEFRPVTDVAADRRAGAAGSRTDHNPCGNRLGFPRKLREKAFGDVVVAAPIRGPLGAREWFHEVAIGL